MRLGARNLNRTVWAASRFASIAFRSGQIRPADKKYPRRECTPRLARVAGDLADGEGLEIVKVDFRKPTVEKLVLNGLDVHVALRVLVPASTRTMQKAPAG